MKLKHAGMVVHKAAIMGGTAAVVVMASLAPVSAMDKRATPLPSPNAQASPNQTVDAISLNPIVFGNNERQGIAAEPSYDDQVANALSDHLRVMKGRLRARAAAAGKADRSASFAQHERVEQLRNALGNAVDVRLRAGAQTPMLIKGKGLERSGGVSSDPKVRYAETAGRFLNANRSLLRLDNPQDELKLERTITDRLGRTKASYSQRYRGLPVWPTTLNVHLDTTGAVDLANGAFVETPNGLDVSPKIDREAAAAHARTALGVDDNVQIQDQQLIIFAPGTRTPKLAWRMTVEASPAYRWDMVIDAKNARTLARYTLVKEDSNVAGSGIDLFGQGRALNVWRSSADGLHYLNDTSKLMFDPETSAPPALATTNGGIIVLDLRNQPIDGDLFRVTSPSATSWPLPDGVSAAANMSEAYDYWLEEHGRNSLDGVGGTIIGVVRLENNLHNAFWNGRAMYFGDAEPWAGAMDFVGHELAHGVIENEANLIYQDQPGAMNESFADIFGEAAEARLFGTPDWVLGQRAGFPLRNMIDPSVFGDPSKMSEFVFTDKDNGGVHINSSIINRAYYLLAEGLSNAIGAKDAERIFYRALTTHLTQNSQFIDLRLAAIQSAEELFGAGASQAKVIAQAFDEIELFDGAQTPGPDPFPGTPGDDATVFVFVNGDGETRLGRREDAFGDSDLGKILTNFEVDFARPAVSGDGSFAIFVDQNDDLCLVPTDATEAETCAGIGDVASVAMSPDGKIFGIILNDPDTGEPSNQINIINLDNEADNRSITLEAPANDGDGNAATVLYADALDFSANGRLLFYDALNVVDTEDRSQFGSWSIYAYDLTNDRIFNIISPIEGKDFGFPAIGQTRDDLITFDAFDRETGLNTVYAGNLSTGELTQVATTSNYAVPGFTGDDSAIVYSQVNTTQPTRADLMLQPLGADQITPEGSATLWLEDADFGVIYRRGTFTGPAANLPIASSVLPSSRSVQVGGTATVFATLINSGAATARGCSIVPMTGVPGQFFFQARSGETNAAAGSPNLPVDIPAGGAQNFVVSFSPSATLTPIEVELSFACENSLSSTTIPGVNTLLLSASSSSVADVVALAATAGNDGIVTVPGVNRTGVFSVATVNLGAAENITVSADTGGVNIPVDVFVCETSPATGACITGLAPSIDSFIRAGGTPTFGVFVQANAASGFDPATRRIYVRFKDSSGVTRGSTSTALRVQ